MIQMYTLYGIVLSYWYWGPLFLYGAIKLLIEFLNQL